MNGPVLKPLIKWPGGKSSEISKIENLIPCFDRYIEPFFGGGALFFYLRPDNAAINDISESLMTFYALLKEESQELKELLVLFDNCLDELSENIDANIDRLITAYEMKKGNFDNELFIHSINSLVQDISLNLCLYDKGRLITDCELFHSTLKKMVIDKIERTLANEKKSSFAIDDLRNNIETGFYSGFYMYFREVYNDFELGRTPAPSQAYRTAVFFFIREYCYGSMFRFNKAGEFNIPYGGMSYNKKRMSHKISRMYSGEVTDLLHNSLVSCEDFESFLNKCNLSSEDFIFLDPPYDTNFSDYDKNKFTKDDHVRLANFLSLTPAQFLLVIKNTDYIYNLYNRDEFEIKTFDNTYSYNVRGRNNRSVEHLIIQKAS